MRKARYDMRQVVCPNSSGLGYSSNIAKPGYWVTYKGMSGMRVGRVLGRIAKTQRDGMNSCDGWLVIVQLAMADTFAHVIWLNPTAVAECYEKPPARLLAWITGSEWVKSKHDIARIIAMSEHGTLSDEFIDNRDKPDQAYNARPEYIAQFILE